MNEEPDKKRTFTEEIEVAGSELIDRVKELMRDGNARRVTIRSQDGTELLSVPLTVGVVAGGLITVSAPLLAALGALAALITRCKLEVVRVVDDRSEGSEPPSNEPRA